VATHDIGVSKMTSSRDIVAGDPVTPSAIVHIARPRVSTIFTWANTSLSGDGETSIISDTTDSARAFVSLSK